MNNRICIFLILLLSFSCTGAGQRKHSEIEVVEEEKLGKLEQLLLLPRDSIMDYYDLSNDSISDFPDLSDYTIKSLDLSYNLLDTVIVNFLPKEIVILNLSNNCFYGIFEFKHPEEKDLFKSKNSEEKIWRPDWEKLYEYSTIREIDLSHNRLIGIDIGFPLRKIIISHNDIGYINFNHRNIEYIDISHNPNLSNVVQFDPYVIDTIIWDNIANDKELVPSNLPVPHIDYIILDDSAIQDIMEGTNENLKRMIDSMDHTPQGGELK